VDRRGRRGGRDEMIIRERCAYLTINAALGRSASRFNNIHSKDAQQDGNRSVIRSSITFIVSLRCLFHRTPSVAADRLAGFSCSIVSSRCELLLVARRYRAVRSHLISKNDMPVAERASTRATPTKLLTASTRGDLSGIQGFYANRPAYVYGVFANR